MATRYDPQRETRCCRMDAQTCQAKIARPRRLTRPRHTSLKCSPIRRAAVHMGHVPQFMPWATSLPAIRPAPNFGYNVLHPMGWDASRTCRRPRMLRPSSAGVHRVNRPFYENIAAMRDPLKKLGLSPTRLEPGEFATCRIRLLRRTAGPMFLKKLDKGLSSNRPRRARSTGNPVDIRCWPIEQCRRCAGAGVPVRVVEQRELTQWFSAYPLCDDLLQEAAQSFERWHGKKSATMQAN